MFIGNGLQRFVRGGEGLVGRAAGQRQLCLQRARAGLQSGRQLRAPGLHAGEHLLRFLQLAPLVGVGQRGGHAGQQMVRVDTGGLGEGFHRLRVLAFIHQGLAVRGGEAGIAPGRFRRASEGLPRAGKVAARLERQGPGQRQPGVVGAAGLEPGQVLLRLGGLARGQQMQCVGAVALAGLRLQLRGAGEVLAGLRVRAGLPVLQPQHRLDVGGQGLGVTGLGVELEQGVQLRHRAGEVSGVATHGGRAGRAQVFLRLLADGASVDEENHRAREQHRHHAHLNQRAGEAFAPLPVLAPFGAHGPVPALELDVRRPLCRV